MQLNPATYQTAAAVTPSDTNPQQYRALYVGGAGNVAVKTLGGNSVTFQSVPAGAVLPIEVIAVLAAGTTATNIVGMA